MRAAVPRRAACVARNAAIAAYCGRVGCCSAAAAVPVSTAAAKAPAFPLNVVLALSEEAAVRGHVNLVASVSPAVRDKFSSRDLAMMLTRTPSGFGAAAANRVDGPTLRSCLLGRRTGARWRTGAGPGAAPTVQGGGGGPGPRPGRQAGLGGPAEAAGGDWPSRGEVARRGEKWPDNGESGPAREKVARPSAQMAKWLKEVAFRHI